MSQQRAGFVLGSLAVLLFSFSLPATRLAVQDIDPWLVSLGRAVVAGLLSAAVLAIGRAPRPTGRQWRSLVIVAAGVVFGFPVLTSLALHHRTAAHGAVITAVMPAATAVFAVIRAGERPSRGFWLASGAGMLAVLAFALSQGAGGLERSDVYLLGAVVLVGIGYAEGGALARELGGARTICWALVVSLPLLVPVVGLRLAAVGVDAGTNAWLGFAYVSVVSMFLGFFAWYAGLARGGVAKIGQVQLAQPVLTLGFSAAVLGETVSPGSLLTAVVVLACVAATQRARVAAAPRPGETRAEAAVA